MVEEEVNTGRLVIEQALESAEVCDARRAICNVRHVICNAQAGLAQDYEASAGDGAAEGGVKSTGEEVDEEETLGEGGSRRRGRKVGDDL